MQIALIENFSTKKFAVSLVFPYIPVPLVKNPINFLL